MKPAVIIALCLILAAALAGGWYLGKSRSQPEPSQQPAPAATPGNPATSAPAPVMSLPAYARKPRADAAVAEQERLKQLASQQEAAQQKQEAADNQMAEKLANSEWQQGKSSLKLGEGGAVLVNGQPAEGKWKVKEGTLWIDAGGVQSSARIEGDGLVPVSGAELKKK